MKLASFAIAALALSFSGFASPESRDIARGRLVEKVICADSKDHSYALYLPSRYDGTKRWPILYVLDPRGRAKLAAEVFQPAAERFGYIIASSYDSASDTFEDRNLPAMQAMWRDTHAILGIDDRRVYAAGFSGTARSAFHMGMAAPRSFAGIIAAGGGFPPDEPPIRSMTFVVFATVGVLDFNYYEMLQLETRLTELAIPSRLEVFDGRHQWPRSDLAERALAWMEIQGMRAGLREKDAALVEEIWSSEIERARRLVGDQRLADARRLYSSLASDFQGLRDVATAQQAAADLGRNRSLRKEEARRRSRNERDERYLRSAAAVFARLRLETPVPRVGELETELEIGRLLRAAADEKDVEEARSARRRLNNVLVYASFYLPRGFLKLGQYDRAIVSLGIAMKIEPDDPEIEYDLARCYAGKRDRERTLSHLRAALSRGFDGKDVAKQEALFDWLRGDPEFDRVGLR
jgi:predicted esterase